VSVLARMAKDINPEAKVTEFGKGVNEANLDEFLKGVDLFIDGYDFFVIDIRCKTYKRCRELGIPAFVAAPVGMGVAFMAFTRDSMSFEEFFRLDGQNELRQYINFLIGLSPSGMHGAYLVEPQRLNVATRKTPSTIVGVELCASYTAAQAAKLLLGRGEVKVAPCHYHFDAYLNKFEVGPQPGNGAENQRRKGDDIERGFREKLDGAPKRESAASH
jgi:molybdopterin/thiamine biosynthesis adenylyltransferase